MNKSIPGLGNILQSIAKHWTHLGNVDYCFQAIDAITDRKTQQFTMTYFSSRIDTKKLDEEAFNQTLYYIGKKFDEYSADQHYYYLASKSSLDGNFAFASAAIQRIQSTTTINDAINNVVHDLTDMKETNQALQWAERAADDVGRNECLQTIAWHFSSDKRFDEAMQTVLRMPPTGNLDTRVATATSLCVKLTSSGHGDVAETFRFVEELSRL